MPGATSRLGLYLPGGGSTGVWTPDEVADIDKINQNMQKLDAAIGAPLGLSTARPSTPFSGQLFRETNSKRLSLWDGDSWEEGAPGVIPAGTTAERDAYWPTPAAGQRAAFALQVPRWFNTDKGYVQQYFAQYDDSGVTASTPVRSVHGWMPAAYIGRVPLTRFTGAVSAGTGTKKGGVYEFTNAPIVRLDQLFSADFENYEIDIQIDTTSTDAGLFMRLRAGGVDQGASAYFSSAVRVSLAGSVSAVNGNGVSDIQVSEAGAAGGEATVRLKSPFETKRTYLDSEGVASPVNMWRVSGFTTGSTSCDGFAIQTGGAPTMNGRIRVYGINRM